MALASRLRRPAAAQPGRNPPLPENPAAPSAPRRPRKPRAVAPTQPAKPGWFGRKPRQPTPANRSRSRTSEAEFFTAESHPELSPEARAFFNTPVEDCDPDELRLVLTMFARQIADAMGPALGMDVEALLSTLCDRLAVPDLAGPDAAPPEGLTQAPDAPPAMPPEDSAPAAPDAVPTASTEAAPDALPVSPPPPLLPPGTDDAPIAAGIIETRPDAARPIERDLPDNLPPFERGQPFRCRHGPLVRQHRPRPARFSLGGPPRRPLRKLCYAACAGPP